MAQRNGSFMTDITINTPHRLKSMGLSEQNLHHTHTHTHVLHNNENTKHAHGYSSSESYVIRCHEMHEALKCVIQAAVCSRVG